MKVEKIENYPSLTIDEQETVLTWDAKERKIYDENVNVPLKIEMFRCDDGKRHLFDTKYDYKIIEAIVKGGYND